MNILLCGDGFPYVVSALQKYLPADEIIPSAIPDLPRRLPTADVIIPAMHFVGPEVMDASTARMIHQFGVGLEGVDVDAATQRGLYVANVPGSIAMSNAVSVAEHAIFLMLALARQYPKARQNLQAGVWGQPQGIGLRGKTVCILGMGNIGKALARRLKPFEMTILGVKRDPTSGVELDLGLESLGSAADLPSLLPRADFVVLALPLNDETRSIVGAPELEAMKNSAYIINVGRGPLIEHDALVGALASGQIAGAGLDVFREEPVDPADPVFEHNVIATPHIGGVTDTSYDEIARGLAGNVERLRLGQSPINCVNLSELAR